MGIKRVRMEEIPKEMKCFGYREGKNGRNTQKDEMFWVQRREMKEIPKEMKCFGYRESKNGRNTQQEK